jgi:flagellin
MPMVVNTNQGSLSAQRSLAASGVELKQAMERLSSGKKINSAADDAAGFAIAERMTAQIRGLNMATKNANDGLSMLATVENATNDVTDMLQRIRELAVQAANDTNSVKDRGFLQTEVNSLLQEINRVATQTIYNNKPVLDGNLTGHFQVGTEKGQTISFDIKSIDTDTLGLTDLDTSATPDFAERHRLCNRHSVNG